MAKHEIKIAAHSITDSPEPTQIVTFMLRYWRAFHGELLTHRVFSRCSGSSRAIPTKKIIAEVWNDPAGPTMWGVNKPGMQSHAELQGWRLWTAKALWKAASRTACVFAWALNKVGLHKQYANRGLEAYQYIRVMVTTTDKGLAGFRALRDHHAAMPEFGHMAKDMGAAFDASTPVLLKDGDWHLPLITPEERKVMPMKMQLKVSAARNARTSYHRHDGKPATSHEDMKLHDSLVADEPKHASPTEHQVMFTAKPMPCRRKMEPVIDLQGNLRGKGLVQYRKLVENKDAYRYYLGRDEYTEPHELFPTPPAVQAVIDKAMATPAQQTAVRVP